MTAAHSTAEEFRAAARAWLRANLEPTGTTAANRGPGHGLTADALEAQRARQRRVFDAGYAGLTVPTAYGGAGLDAEHQRAFNEEAAAFDMPHLGIAGDVTTDVIVPVLLAHGAEDQKRRWIPPMLRGDELWVQLLSEPDAGSDLAGVRTRADRDGDHWVINGAKTWTSGASLADYGLCLARTDWEVPKQKGLTWFCVPLRAPGVEIRPIREINGSEEFCETFLTDVVVPDDHIVGDPNDGWSIAATLLTFERGFAPTEGAADRARDSIRGFCPDLIALSQAADTLNDSHVRQLLARAHVNDWMHRHLLHHLATEVARHERPALAAAAFIKLSRGINDSQRARTTMEIAGPSAISWDPDDDAGHRPSTDYLNGRIYAIAGGSNQIQRNIISERILGLPREPAVDNNRPFSEVLRHVRQDPKR